MSEKKSEQGKEVEKRRDAILKKMLETPPKPKVPPKPKKGKEGE